MKKNNKPQTVGSQTVIDFDVKSPCSEQVNPTYSKNSSVNYHHEPKVIQLNSASRIYSSILSRKME